MKLTSIVWVLAVLALCYVGTTGGPARQLLCAGALAYLAAWGGFFLASGLSQRQKTIRFITTSLAVTMSIAVIECTVLLGLLDFRMIFGRELAPWDNPGNLRDPELHHLHRPHLHARGVVKGGDLVQLSGAEPITINRYDFRYDQNGFRNAEDYERADLVVVGDSFVEGANVADDELMTTRLSAELNAVVANLGQAYYSPQQELIVLRRFGLPMKPRLVVWIFFGGNDLGDVSRYKQQHAELSKPQNASWKERSFTLNFALWMSQKGVVHEVDFSRSGILTTNPDKPRLWFGYPGMPLSKRQETATAAVVKIIEEAAASCRENNARLLFVFAPSKYRVYAKSCEFADDSPIRLWQINDLPDRLAKGIGAIESDIGFLDLTPAFQEAGDAGKMLYFPDDSHWSAAGHELAADVISQRIHEKYSRYLSEKNHAKDKP